LFCNNSPMALINRNKNNHHGGITTDVMQPDSPSPQLPEERGPRFVETAQDHSTNEPQMAEQTSFDTPPVLATH